MGSGARAYRVLAGESKAIQEHQLSMIPIVREQTVMQLEMQEKAFELQYEQTEKMNLLSMKLQPAPIYIPAETRLAKPMASKYLTYAGLAALAYFFLR